MHHQQHDSMQFDSASEAIYSDQFERFSREDWLELAYLAVDQSRASETSSDIEYVYDLLGTIMNEL